MTRGIAEPTARAHVSTTERVNFAPGGTIHVDRSYGDLRVEGWDRPEVEVTVTKAMPCDYKRKHPEQGPQHLEAVHIVTEHPSNTELTISTTTPSRPFHLGLTSRSVIAEYEPYRVGERYATPNSKPAPRIYLRQGFGGITIKALPPEAYLTQNLK